ncbi:MAG: hypothetical protein LBR60_04250 [Fibrobacter sp.]|jgi:hypothetical protein|nr:hypothetical protein [Fibrobacter sp.]
MKKEKHFVGLFLDGFTLRKVNEYYRNYHPRKAVIHLARFREWCFENVLKSFCLDGNFQTESHYYHPFENPRLHEGKFQGTLLFEKYVLEARFQMHYNQPSPLYLGKPNMELADDIFLLSSYQPFRAVILVTTQGQYVPVLSRLRQMNIPTLLVGWNFEYPGKGRTVRWRTDEMLQKKCARYLDATGAVSEIFK